jgi:hypothetical protein
MRWYKNQPWMVERPIIETFEYYSDIATYSSKYPRYYGKINIIDKSDGNFKTEEFLNLNLDLHRDHASIRGHYHIKKPNKVSFKIMGDTFVDSISGELTFTSQEFKYNKERREGTLVSGTISALEVISQPPGSIDSTEYERMLVYLGMRDRELLEGASSPRFRAGQLCTRCGKGKLRNSGEKEHTRTEREFPLTEQEVEIEVLVCDYCGSPFESTIITLK